MAISQLSIEELIKRVSQKGERIILSEEGDGAALISLIDLQKFEELEDKDDNEAADAAMKEAGENISLNELERQLGLES